MNPILVVNEIIELIEPISGYGRVSAIHDLRCVIVIEDGIRN